MENVCEKHSRGPKGFYFWWERLFVECLMSGKESRAIGDSIEETRRYHERYLRAISSPLRREILRAVKDGCMTVEDLRARTGLDEKALNWHLSILEHGFCVEKDTRKGELVYRLTQEGKVVDFLK